MGIYIRCTKCKRDYKLGTKLCKKCGINLATYKKYKVAVVVAKGRRSVKIVDTYELAKKVESSIKGKVVEKRLLGLEDAPYIDEVWEMYLKWAKANKKSWKADKSRWEMHVASVTNDIKMDAISRADIDKILNAMEESGGRSGNGYSKATIKQVIMLIKRVYNWAIETEVYNGKSPVANIKPPKVNNQVTECLSPEELNRLYAVLDGWWNKMAALIVRFALYTGLRADEIMGLKWKDVDIETGFLSLDDPKGKPVKLPLNNAAMGILDEAGQISRFPDCEYVFHNKFGKRRRTFTHIWYRIRNRAELPKGFRFHGLRHTYASYLASSGEVDLYTLQKLLNHQDPKMTQRYAHLLDSALRKGANVAGNVFGNGQVRPSP